MKKNILLNSLVVLTSLLFTACAANNTGDGNSQENISQVEMSPQPIETQTGEFRNIPLPEPEDRSTDHVFEDHITAHGTVGEDQDESEDESLSKWIVLMESGDGNTVTYNSWKEAGEALGLDLSFLNSNSCKVVYHNHLSEDIGASDNYVLLQSDVPTADNSSSVPVLTEEEYEAMCREYSLNPEIKCASVFIGKDSSKITDPEKYRENFRALGGEYAYKEYQAAMSNKAVLKEAKINGTDIIFYSLPAGSVTDESDPNTNEVSLCADITYDNCLVEISFGIINKTEAENAAEKMYKLLSESAN